MPLAPSFDTFGWFADDIETYEAVGRHAARAPIRIAACSKRAVITMARLDALVLGGEEADGL